MAARSLLVSASVGACTVTVWAWFQLLLSKIRVTEVLKVPSFDTIRPSSAVAVMSTSD